MLFKLECSIIFTLNNLKRKKQDIENTIGKNIIEKYRIIRCTSNVRNSLRDKCNNQKNKKININNLIVGLFINKSRVVSIVNLN